MVEKSEKSKLGLGILIGVLVTLVIGLSGFIIYDKVLSNNDINQQEYDNEIVEDDNSSEDNLKELSESEVEGILEKINVYLNNFVVSYPIKNFNNFSNNMSNQEKLNFLWSHIPNYSYGDSFSKNTLDEVASKYFNDDFSYTNENINCSICNTSQYNYNKQTGIYMYNDNHPGHGGGGSYRDTSYFVSAFYDSKTNEYIVNTKILYGDHCADVCGPIQKFYDSNSRKNVVYENKYVDSDPDITKVYESVKDKLPITVYKFVKNKSNEIILKSVTNE